MKVRTSKATNGNWLAFWGEEYSGEGPTEMEAKAVLFNKLSEKSLGGWGAHSFELWLNMRMKRTTHPAPVASEHTTMRTDNPVSAKAFESWLGNKVF
jgi:hypothetical protein